MLILIAGMLAAPTMAQHKMPYKTAGEGTTLVLIPGGLTGWQSWDPFVPIFSKDHRVVQVQLLSVHFGLEDRPLPEDYSVRMESEALYHSLTEIGIDAPADLIGWSFGAFVLLDFALQHPEMVRSLTLIEPPAFWLLKAHDEVDDATQRVMDDLRTLSGEITADQLERFMTSVGFAPPGTPLRDHPNWENWMMHRRSLRNSAQVTMHEDDPGRLHSLDVPVLLVKGEGSAPFLHRIIDLLDRDLPNSSVAIFVGGHAPHLASRDEFLRTYEAFTAGVGE